MLGGRAAEEIIFGQITTGAGNDIEQATALARKMVCEWGMSEEMGPLKYGRKEEMVFLGKELTHERDYSEATQQRIDKEVRRLVEDAHANALRVLRENMDSLHVVAKALLEREILDGPEIDKILRGEELDPVRTMDPEKPSEIPPVAARGKESEEPRGGIQSSPDPHPGPA